MSIVIPSVTIIDTIYGTGVSALAPVRAATISAGVLASGFENGDTIDGITLTTAIEY